jgi:hypothetical protein
MEVAEFIYQVIHYWQVTYRAEKRWCMVELGACEDYSKRWLPGAGKIICLEHIAVLLRV